MIYSRNEMRAAIDEYVLNDRHRMLLQLKLVEGMTYGLCRKVVFVIWYR